MNCNESGDYLIKLIDTHNTYCKSNYNYEALEVLYNYYVFISKSLIKKVFMDNEENFSDTFIELFNTSEKLKRARKANYFVIRNVRLKNELLETSATLKTADLWFDWFGD